MKAASLAFSMLAILGCESKHIATSTNQASVAPKTTSSTATTQVNPTKTRPPSNVVAGKKDVTRPKSATNTHAVKDRAKAVATVLMDTMTRRDIESAKALFPGSELLTKHFPGPECQAFRDTVLSHRAGLFPRSRAWVKESISRILHPKNWKKEMSGMKDEIATSLGLQIEGIEKVSDVQSSLQASLSTCEKARKRPLHRYRATYHAEILDKTGSVQLDGEVMKLAGQGWYVVGY